MATQLQVSPETPRLAQLMRMGPSAPQLGLVFALAAGLTLAAGVFMWATRPSFVPLDLGLSERNAGDVIARLQASDTRFEVDQRSGTILVPGDQLREIRLRLAADGLGSSEDASLGDILSKDQSVGTSQFIERARYQHGLETDLAHTVARMRGIEAARVHLAIPKQSAFVRDRARPSASVLLRLAPGRALDAGQVQGIANLVASSVPYMEIGRVTVVDQYGRLLSRDVADGEMALSNRQFEFKRAFERTYTDRIEELLAPIIGRQGVRAQVHADLDFSENERRQEAYAGAPEKVRSEQIEDQRAAGSLQAMGVPGALSNQPPEGGSLKQGAGSGDTTGETGSITKSTTRNYELDKTVTHTHNAPGRLTRLSVAVLVDDRVTAGKKGAVERTPREQAELDSITDLVKEAVGFNKERGDSVLVINRSFETPPAIEVPPEPALWEQSWFESTVKTTLAAILMGLVLLLVLRPTVSALTRRLGAGGSGAGTGEDGDVGLLEADRVSIGARSVDPLPPPPRVYGDILNLAREMANDDPKRVAMVLKRWVEDE